MCISGSIAAYKACDLVRELRREGASVTVVLSKNATQFITPLTLQALTGKKVFVDALCDGTPSGMAHIELGRQADVALLAPASAHKIAQLAQGMADDLISCLFLATSAPRLIAPAMNMHMWHHQATQANCARLQEYGYTLIAPVDGEQVCGDVGVGKLASVDALLHAVVAATKDKPLDGKRILITVGGTREWLDPVRYLGNASSGKTGVAFAHACYYLGGDVTLVATNSSQESFCVTRVEVDSAQQMYEYVMAAIDDYDMFISVAAVADFAPVHTHTHKIKKNKLDDTMQISCTKNPDILSTVAKHLRSSNKECRLVGFAAETDLVLEHAKEKIHTKEIDAIVANNVCYNKSFMQDDSDLFLLTRASEGVQEYNGAKKYTALLVMQDIAHMFYQ